MSNYVIIWKYAGEAQYFYDSTNTPEIYTITKTNKLGKAKVFSTFSEAEFERCYIDRYTRYNLATTIIVNNKELFEARLKGD